jgi:hypothetical protein
MENKIVAVTTAMLCAFAPTLASASEAEAPPVKVARASPQLAYPNSAPRGTQTYHRGEVIMTVPLMWEIGAKLPQATTIHAGDDSEDIAAGSVLQGVMLTESASHRDEMAYCTPRKAAERKADSGMLGALLGGGSLWRGAIRGATDRQYCLIDSDDDGIADHSVELHAGSQTARTPIAIAPVQLGRDRMIPISEHDDCIEIVLVDVSANGSSAKFRINVIQQGADRVFDTIGQTPRLTYVTAKKGLPARTDIFHALFDVVSIDGTGRTAVVKWPDDVDAKAIVPIDDGLHIVMRW